MIEALSDGYSSSPSSPEKDIEAIQTPIRLINPAQAAFIRADLFKKGLSKAERDRAFHRDECRLVVIMPRVLQITNRIAEVSLRFGSGICR